MTTLHIGPRGRAQQLDIRTALRGAECTVTWWLLEGPWHPVWPQFVLSVVHLRPMPGWPAPNLHFDGATHELLVVALNPGDPPAQHKAATLTEGGFRAVGGYLKPVDVVHQFTATDSEMVELAELCARACVDGLLTPSTDDARTTLRETWLTSCVRTLAHIRGEEHAP